MGRHGRSAADHRAQNANEPYRKGRTMRWMVFGHMGPSNGCITSPAVYGRMVAYGSSAYHSRKEKARHEWSGSWQKREPGICAGLDCEEVIRTRRSFPTRRRIRLRTHRTSETRCPIHLRTRRGPMPPRREHDSRPLLPQPAWRR